MIYVSRIFVAMIIYTFIVLLLLAIKPSLMFDLSGNPKPFGVGMKDGYSVFAPSVVFPFLAVLSYLIASVSVFILV